MNTFLTRQVMLFPILIICSNLFAFSGGSGTPEDPYQIATVEDLMAIRGDFTQQDKFYILVKDIDLSPSQPGGKVFSRAVIASFKGSLDGNGHVIRNLFISGDDNLGLFNTLWPSARIVDLGLERVWVKGSGQFVGALAGIASGEIRGCYSTGTVEGFRRVGGLVGKCYHECKVADSHGRCVVKGEDYVGGLAGEWANHGVAGYDAGSIIACKGAGRVNGSKNVGGLLGHSHGTVTRSSSSAIVNGVENVGGLVGSSGGPVRDCFSTSTVTGTLKVGGLVGHGYDHIVDCYSSGRVEGESEVGGLVGSSSLFIRASYSSSPVRGIENVGGLVGRNSNLILACYSTGAVRGREATGGLVGDGGSIIACFSTGAVRGIEKVGGLVGRNGSGISCSYSTGLVSGSHLVGGLVGDQYNAASVISSFWDIDASGLSSSSGGTGISTEQMQSFDTFLDAGWDFTDEPTNGTTELWLWPQETGYPLLSVFAGYEAILPEGNAEEPYLISMVQELGSIWFRPQAHYQLIADIDLTPQTWITAVIPWFDGVFRGNGHTLHNLSIKGTGFLGLFGLVGRNAHINNLGLQDVELVGTGSKNGCLAGYNWGDVNDCFCTGSVSGFSDIGGLVGSNFAGSINLCHSTVTVSGQYSIGGLMGSHTSRMGQAIDCYSDGRVEGSFNVGGLAGFNFGGHINRCFSRAAVQGDMTVGGLVGNHRGHIVSSYYDGTVQGENVVGGLVGENDGEEIRNCYSAGSVTGTSHTGGLIGRNGWQLRDDADGVFNSFWDIDSSGQTTSASGTGLLSQDMMVSQTYLDADWDFQSTWSICEEMDYPHLQWEKLVRPD